MEYGYKGKGVTVHWLVEGQGFPVNAHITSLKGDEQQKVMLLISAISQVFLGVNLVLLEADKGYDCRELCVNLLKCGIYPLIPYRGKKHQIAPWVKKIRWKVERTISWMKRGFRRIATRWERLVDAYSAVVHGGTLKNVDDQWGYANFETMPKEGTKEYKLFQAIYGDTEINRISMHDQAIDRVPKGFTVLAQIDDVPKLTTNENGSILLSQFHPEDYVEMEDSEHMLNKIDWDWIYNKFRHKPAIIAKIKAYLRSYEVPQKEDIARWKHFFDFYVEKAADYQHRKKLVAAAAA